MKQVETIYVHAIIVPLVIDLASIDSLWANFLVVCPTFGTYFKTQPNMEQTRIKISRIDKIKRLVPKIVGKSALQCCVKFKFISSAFYL